MTKTLHRETVDALCLMADKVDEAMKETGTYRDTNEPYNESKELRKMARSHALKDVKKMIVEVYAEISGSDISMNPTLAMTKAQIAEQGPNGIEMIDSHTFNSVGQ